MAQYIDQFGNLRFTQENESNGILDLYNKNQIDFNEQINMEPRDIAPPMNMDEMMYGSVLPNNQFNPTNFQSIFPASGNMQQAPLDMNRFQGVSDMSIIDETTNDEQVDYLPGQKSSLKDSLSNMGKKFGLSSLLGLITGNPILGLIGRGIGALSGKAGPGFNDFKSSSTGAEFFQKMRDRRARDDAAARGEAKANMADARSITDRINTGPTERGPNENTGGGGTFGSTSSNNSDFSDYS